MADIPNIFGGPYVVVSSKTNPTVTKDHTKNQENVPKRPRHNAKKQKTEDIPKNPHVAKDPPVAAATVHQPSRVFKEIGKIGDSLLSKNEYKKWMAKSQEQKLAIATRASLELLLFNTEQSQSNKNTSSRIKELEDELSKLKIDMKNTKTKTTNLEAEKKTLETTNASLQQDLAHKKDLVKERDKTIAELEETITDLQLDVEELETAKNAAHGEGIRTYCKTFLADEPNYDWRAKFGKHMATFMADLAEKETEFITAKRAELEKMVANEAEELAQQEVMAQQKHQNPPPANENLENDSNDV